MDPERERKLRMLTSAHGEKSVRNLRPRELDQCLEQVHVMLARRAPPAVGQGLTLVHFSAQRKRFLWYRGFIEGLLRVCLAGV
jgi:hypothetical protein